MQVSGQRAGTAAGSCREFGVQFDVRAPHPLTRAGALADYKGVDVAKSSEVAEAFRLAGISMREAGRSAARGGYRLVMAFHSSHEVSTGPREGMLVCRMCRPVTAWPCEQYERAERGLAEAS